MSYPMYVINGYRFHSSGWSIGKKTNNTGVWVRGDSGGGESDWLVPEIQPPDTLRNSLVDDDVILIQVNNPGVDDEEDEEPSDADHDVEGCTEEEDLLEDEVHMYGRSRGSSQKSRGRARGRGRAITSSDRTPSSTPSTSTPGTSLVAPTIPLLAALSPQPAATDFQQADPSLQ
ncbi:hypothetical protein PIB30_028912 [Stylosanthes scabra]|uniref:Uncharacterized protein n=1 Tax=Stylosanthes scabra TaxID=79078 RepID=A0ABU6QBA1_9FABA|nr:hypothetical protein [Stylosanthes scabra]